MAIQTFRPRFFPWRYGMFLLLLLALALPLGLLLPWYEAVMAAFDIAALGFLATIYPLLGYDADDMRQAAERNDANRELMLLITAIVTAVILVAVGVAVSTRDGPQTSETALLLFTLLVAWIFSNMIYALHYAHIFYLPGEHGKDRGGIDFPAAKEPGYWDFLYFAFTLGMTFQTSDAAITALPVRKVALFHSFAAFLFNLGILAFTINVLGGE